MLAADSVAINRLHVKGDKRTSQTLVRELEQTSWTKPLPAHLQHAWILVRELKVTGKARDLRQQTAQHLDTELQQAVRAIHGNSAAANVIWFASLPELIAFLSVDLALGKTTHWYWSRWVHLLKYPRHDAMVRLLCEHIEHLPAIIMQLHHQQQLALVFNKLSESGAKTLVRELARVCGFPDPATWHTTTSTMQNVVMQDITRTLTAQAGLLSVWRPLLRGLNPQDGRVMLATALHGLIYTPLWLQQQVSVLAQVISSMVTTMPVTSVQSTSAPDNTWRKMGAEGQVQRFTPLEKNQQQTENFIAEKNSANQSFDVAGKKDESLLPVVQRPVTPEAQVKLDVIRSAAASASQSSGAASEQSPDYLKDIHSTNSTMEMQAADEVASVTVVDHQPVGQQFITTAGGFFYLLNPLRMLLTQDRLATQSEASVWYWLLDLYRVFAQQFPVLDGVMDEPLRHFMLRQLHPEATHHELQTLSAQMMLSPPSEFATQLFADLHERYQYTDFWQELANTEGFFATTARVLASASHWDIYFPLSSVRLDLRLAAWDVNPGWLPWLGRVVAFHYVETPLVAQQGGWPT